MPHLQPKTILLLVLFHLSNTAEAVVNSICGDSGLVSLRACAASCVACNRGGKYEIGEVLGCGIGTAPYQNECWCRTDLYNDATSGLSNCVSRYCTVGGWEVDYSTALKFYTNYCRKAGFTAVPDAPANVVATITLDANAPTVTRVTYVTQTSLPISASSAGVTVTGPANVTASSKTLSTITKSQLTVDVISTIKVSTDSTSTNEPKAGGNGLSTSDKIALGVGIGLGLPATIAAIASYFIAAAKK